MVSVPIPPNPTSFAGLEQPRTRVPRAVGNQGGEALYQTASISGCSRYAATRCGLGQLGWFNRCDVLVTQRKNEGNPNRIIWCKHKNEPWALFRIISTCIYHYIPDYIGLSFVMDLYCNKLPPPNTKKWELGIVLGLFRTPYGEVLNIRESGYLNQIWNISQLILLNCWGRSSGSDQSGLSFDVLCLPDKSENRLTYLYNFIIPKSSQKYVLELVSAKRYRKAFCLMGKKWWFPIRCSLTAIHLKDTSCCSTCLWCCKKYAPRQV